MNMQYSVEFRPVKFTKYKPGAPKHLLVEKGREQMEGWEQGRADGGDKVDKMRQLGLAWEAVLAPSATGKPPSAKKAAGRVRCLAEQTARAAGTTMDNVSFSSTDKLFEPFK